jgi:hypothetical protein
MSSKRGLAGTAFLARENDDVHFGFLPRTIAGSLACQKARMHATEISAFRAFVLSCWAGPRELPIS